MKKMKLEDKSNYSDPSNVKKSRAFFSFLIESFEALGFLWDVGKTLIIVVALAFLIRFYLVQPFYVEGQSMEPNFNNGEYLLIDELSYHFRDPQRGEVIVFHPPISTYQNYIKRIIALPGENIYFEDSKVLLEEKGKEKRQLKEDYIPATTATNSEENYMVPEKNYFVMGDNRTQSSDSRVFGPIDKKNITGRVWFYIKTEPWIKLFGDRLVIPKIKSFGTIKKPNY